MERVNGIGSKVSSREGLGAEPLVVRPWDSAIQELHGVQGQPWSRSGVERDAVVHLTIEVAVGEDPRMPQG